MQIKKITFDKNLTPFILNIFNKKTDEEGYIIEKNSKQRVLAKDGTEIKTEDFGGVKKGSEIFIKSDLPSLIELCDDLASNE